MYLQHNHPLLKVIIASITVKPPLSLRLFLSSSVSLICDKSIKKFSNEVIIARKKSSSQLKSLSKLK